MAAAFVLRQHVDAGFKLRVRRDRAGLGDDLPAFDAFALDASQENAHVVAGDRPVQGLLEHFDAGDDGRRVVFLEADDLDVVTDFRGAALDAARGHRAATLDREHVFDRHEERLVFLANRQRNVGVQGEHQSVDRQRARVVRGGILERFLRSAVDDRNLVALEVVLVEQIAEFHDDERNELRVGLVALVHVHDHVGNADLLGEQDVFPGLRHGAVVGGDHQDRGVHLRGTGDHVLDIVGVPGAIDVGVVTALDRLAEVDRFDAGVVDQILVRQRGHAAIGAVVRFVLDVRNGDGHRLVGVADDAALRDFRVGFEVLQLVDERIAGHDRRGQRRFAVVNVADGANVDVRLGPREILLRHRSLAPDMVGARCARELRCASHTQIVMTAAR